MFVPTTPAIRSIGSAAAMLQADPEQIAAAAAALKIRPALVLNGVQHFSEADLERIRRRMQAAKAR